MKKTYQKTVRSIASLLIILLSNSLMAYECASAKDDRFIKQLNGTTHDTHTNLIWMTCPIGLSGSNCQTGEIQRFSWLSSLNIGLESTFNQKSDWRLPTRAELLNIVEPHCTQSTNQSTTASIDSKAFPNTPKSFFWSSSRRHDNLPLAQSINFADGLDYQRDRFQYYYVRLVRSYSQQVDQLPAN